MALSRRTINGVLLLDKPTGVSSNAALQRAKHLFNAAKAGHIGTLDPQASGLLPLCFGEATKFSGPGFRLDKVYLADIVLGVTTDTGDAEGDVLTRAPVPELVDVGAVLQGFLGTVAQTPPAYSAVKLNGKPLYAYARAGETARVASREISIYSLQLIEREAFRLRVRVHCSSGTYVRVLAEDIGRKIGCGAMLSALRRQNVGGFDVSQACNFDALENATVSEREKMLLPVDGLISALPPCILDASEVRRILTGQSGQISHLHVGRVRLYDATRQFLGVGEVLTPGTVVPRRLMSNIPAPETAESVSTQR